MLTALEQLALTMLAITLTPIAWAAWLYWQWRGWRLYPTERKIVDRIVQEFWNRYGGD